MRQSGQYRIITTVVRNVLDKSVWVDAAPGRHGQVNIPRSLLYGPDDLNIDKYKDSSWSFRVMAWKAEELGFA